MADRDEFVELIEPIGTGLAGAAMDEDRSNLQFARDEFYPDGIPAYEEIWNTAYISFDVFTDRNPAEDPALSIPCVRPPAVVIRFPDTEGFQS